MDKFRHYLEVIPKKVADRFEKPLTLITTMAFFCACLVFLPIAGFSTLTTLLVNAGVAIITLLLVLILAYVHGREIRALQARLDEFAAELESVSFTDGETRLSPGEIRRIRGLLAEQASVQGEEARRANRDRRPSLF